MRHFVYLTNTRLVSLVASGRRLLRRAEFPISGTGAAEFERHLVALKRSPTHVFTDLAEEDFRLDTVPHVGAGDRAAIMARKLAQLFRNTPYRHAILQGREPEGRRDDRVVYTAITNPEMLRPWVEMFERLEVPLAGIHSASVLSVALLEQLDLVFPHTLLVTFTPGEGMRQTYFRDREIKFSRLSPVDLQEGQSFGGMIAEETTRTWQYLDSLRHFQPGDRLEVCVLLPPAERDRVRTDLRDFAQIQYHPLAMDEVARKLGMREAPRSPSAEEILVHLFLLRGGDNHFAAPELRRFGTLRRARIGIAQAAGLFLLVGMGWGGWNVYQALDAQRQANALAQQNAAVERDRHAISKELPSGVGGSTMRDVVGFYRATIRGFPTLPEFVEPISQVLAQHPRVRVAQVSWRAVDDPKAVPPLARAATGSTPPVKSFGKGEPPPGSAPVEDPQTAPFTSARYEVALIEGTLSVPRNDFRGALAEIETLAAGIGKLPGFSAEVMESPLDVRSSLGLQGSNAGREEGMMEPRFVLRVSRERKPG